MTYKSSLENYFFIPSASDIYPEKRLHKNQSFRLIFTALFLTLTLLSLPFSKSLAQEATSLQPIVTEIGGSSPSDQGSSIQITSNDLERINGKQVLRIRGKVRGQENIKALAFTLDDGKNWQRISPKKVWNFTITKNQLQSYDNLSVMIGVWDQNHIGGNSTRIGPIQYQETITPKPNIEGLDKNEEKEKSSSNQNRRNSKFHPVRQKQFVAGLTYPGITFGAQSQNFSSELRFYSGNDSTLYGIRGSHHFYRMSPGNIYWGLEALYIGDFEGEITEGDGLMYGGLAGLQIYISSFSSFQIDSGPYLVQIEDDLSGVESDGVHFVINTSLNFHF